MAKTYSLKKQHPRATALVVAEELVRALPDTLIVGSLRRGCEVVGCRVTPSPCRCPQASQASM